MKKYIFTIVAALAIFASLLLRADNERIITVEQLPASAQKFLKQHFSESKAVLVKMETEGLGKSYEVRLSDGTKIEFNKEGAWRDVDCGKRAVPQVLVPNQIKEFVKANYAGFEIVEVEIDKTDEYDVTLHNGLKLEFDKNFILRDIDD